MARSKKHDAGMVFVEPDADTKPMGSLKGVPPNARARKEIMASDEKRAFAAQVIGELRKSWIQPKVNSNRELIERIDKYFAMIEKREVPPTVEELALYCGYTVSTLNDWQGGRNQGFKDEPESGLTTSAIIKKAKEFLHAFDAIMAQTGKMNFLTYCFRSRNYYGMVNETVVTVAPDNGLRQSLTPEEIAKNLPEPMYTDDIQTDYSVTDG